MPRMRLPSVLLLAGALTPVSGVRIIDCCIGSSSPTNVQLSSGSSSSKSSTPPSSSLRIMPLLAAFALTNDLAYSISR